MKQKKNQTFIIGGKKSYRKIDTKKDGKLC